MTRRATNDSQVTIDRDGGAAIGDDSAVSVSLVVFGDDLEPADVTRALGLFPDRSWRRGETPEIPLPDGRRVKHPRAASNAGWKKFQPPELEGSCVEELLSYWTTLLMPKVTAVRSLVACGFVVELDCFIASSGSERVSLDPSLLAGLADISVEVEILFSPGA